MTQTQDSLFSQSEISALAGVVFFLLPLFITLLLLYIIFTPSMSLHLANLPFLLGPSPPYCLNISAMEVTELITGQLF
ncbi:hypothetical protein BDY24DRAFT_417656 [Mrakia frigida]|uniref:uncharacterized protein n=1 Tax=Mrakia frigida TaxID=29902 RepID=UPI003FCBEFA9